MPHPIFLGIGLKWLVNVPDRLVFIGDIREMSGANETCVP